MKFISSSIQALLIVAGLFSAVNALTASPSVIQTMAPTSNTDLPINLGSAANFAVLAGTTVTSSGTVGTVIIGDVGVNPGSAVDGFPPAVLTGTIYGGDAVAGAAQGDLTTAYNTAAARASTTTFSSEDLGGMTLSHGVYKYSSGATLNGVLTLDARGDSNAVWIFQIEDTFLVGGSSQVIFKDSIGDPDNIYWQVGSSATINGNSKMQGNFMALQSISVKSGSTVVGRLLARNAAVTMQTNAVTLPGLKPTGKPTAAPTFRPTSQNSPLISFYSNVTLSGVTTATLSPNAQHAVTNATATSMGIDESAVSYVSGDSTQTARRSLLFLEKPRLNLLATYDILATTFTSVTLSSTDYDNVEDMYTGLTEKFAAAVASGAYAHTLQRNSIIFDVPELAIATASGPTSSPPETVNASKKDDKKLSGGAIAGIVIGGVVFLLLCAALVYYFFFAQPSTTTMTTYEKPKDVEAAGL